MDIKFRVFSSIGHIEVSYYDDSKPTKPAVSAMKIPDEELGEVALACLRRAYHEGHLSAEQVDVIHDVSSMLKERGQS